MAAALLTRQIQDLAEPVEISSAGCSAVARPVPAEVLSVMAPFGIDLGQHRSRQSLTAVLAGCDLVIGMGRRHVHESILLDPPCWPQAFTLKELVRRSEEIGPRRPDQGIRSWIEAAQGDRTRDSLATGRPPTRSPIPTGLLRAVPGRRRRSSPGSPRSWPRRSGPTRCAIRADRPAGVGGVARPSRPGRFPRPGAITGPVDEGFLIRELPDGGSEFVLEQPAVSFIRVDDQSKLQFGETELVIGAPFRLEIDGAVHYAGSAPLDGLGPLLGLYPVGRPLGLDVLGGDLTAVFDSGAALMVLTRPHAPGLVARHRVLPAGRPRLSRDPGRPIGTAGQVAQQLRVAGGHHPPHAVPPVDGGPPTSSCIRVRSICTLSMVSAWGRSGPPGRSARRSSRTTPRC